MSSAAYVLRLPVRTAVLDRTDRLPKGMASSLAVLHAVAGVPRAIRALYSDPEDCFADVRANIGLCSVLAGSVLKQEVVLDLQPRPEAARRIVENAGLDSLLNSGAVASCLARLSTLDRERGANVVGMVNWTWEAAG